MSQQHNFEQYVAKQINEIAMHVKILETMEEADVPISIFTIDNDNENYCLLKGGLNVFTRLSGQILRKKKEWVNKFSEQYIRNLLEPLIVKSKKMSLDELTSEVYKIVTALDNYSKEHTVLLPISKLQMEIEELNLGKVVLRKVTNSLLEELTTKAQNIRVKPEQLKYQQDKQAEIIRLAMGQLGTVFAEIQVIAEPMRAVEQAADECRLAFDLLRYTMASIKPDEYNFNIGISSNINWEVTNYTGLVFSQNSFDLSSPQNKVLTNFTISSSIIEDMEQKGVFAVAKILEKNDLLTEFEDILLRGIHWYANAHIHIERENKLLNLITCLECFFSNKDVDKISNAVAEGVAFTLGKDYEERKYLKKKTKDFYNMRSRVSHGGKKEILDSELNELTELIGNFLANMIRQKDNFANQEDLVNWIERKRLS